MSTSGVRSLENKLMEKDKTVNHQQTNNKRKKWHNFNLENFKERTRYQVAVPNKGVRGR